MLQLINTAIGTTYYDFATLACFATSLPRTFEDDAALTDKNCFEVTSAHIMAKISNFYHQSITRKGNANVPPSVGGNNSEWFNFETLESEENIRTYTNNILSLI